MNSLPSIYMFTGSDFSQSDGPVLHFYSLFTALKKINVNVKAFAPVRKKTYPFEGVNYIFCTSLPMVASIIYQIRLFYVIFSNTKLQKPEVLYIRVHYAMITPLLFSIIFNIPIITEFNGIIKDYVHKKFWLSVFIGRIVEKIHAKKSKAIIAVTPKMKEWISINYKVDLSIIHSLPNAADPALFHYNKKNEYKFKFKLNEKEKIIVYAGTLIWWQGVIYLINAVKIISEKEKNFKVLIIGDGIERKKLEDTSKALNLTDLIIFTGKVPFTIAAEYISASDLCVVPKVPISSGYSPIKLYEYMAAAKPVIASDLPGFEIIRETGCGELFPAQNSNALADRILKLLSLPDSELIEMGLKGREKIIKEFNWDNVARKTFEIIKSIQT